MSAATSTMNGSTSGPASGSGSGSGSAARASSANPSSSSKQQLKSTTAGGKALDGARKQAASPVDASSSRKPATPKAWTQGTNPITQRPNVASPVNNLPNGAMKNGTAPPRSSQNTSAEKNSPDKHAHQRLAFLFANFIGLECAVTFKNGEQYTGVFAYSDLDGVNPTITLKMAKRTKSASDQILDDSEEPSDRYVGVGADHSKAFDMREIQDFNVQRVEFSTSTPRAQNGASSFRTDVEISGDMSMREKALQPWQPSGDAGLDLSLDPKSLGTWDQFAENERRYNVKSDYSEDIYTTAINKADPRYEERKAHAARLAREIESSAPVNSHVAEERTMNAQHDGGLDEEDKYSGVRREGSQLTKGAPNAYIPPSRRPITSQPTVSGAPFDPAIISAQMSRPSPGPSKTSDNHAPSVLKSDSAEGIKQPLKITSNDGSVVTLPIPALTTTPAVDGTAAPSTSKSPASTAGQQKFATEGVEKRVLEQFKQFSNTEKLRVQQHQRNVAEKQRATQRAEKSVKLNDLKKFAENFKLYSRVPEDLVPILAKTKEKQQEIVTKAEVQAREKELTPQIKASVPAGPSKPEVGGLETKAPRALPVNDPVATAAATAAAATSATVPPATAAALTQRQRMSQNLRGQNQPLSSPRGPAPFNQRAPQSPAHFRGGPMPGAAQMPPPLPASIPSPVHSVTSPLSAATRLNVKAMEFRPNPAASTFSPVGAAAPRESPAGSKRGSVSTAPPPCPFSPADKPASERMPLAGLFNPVKRMLEKAEEEGKGKDYAANGGIPQAYRTPPTWECAKENEEKSFVDLMFPKSSAATMSPMHTPIPGVMPHQHQLPPQLQGGPPQMPAAQHTPRFYPAQPHHMANQAFDEHRMQYGSSNSSVQPSPRMTHPQMAFGGMQPQMQHGFPPGVPPYGMTPGMPMRQMPGAGQFGPQGPHVGGHMMAQQASNQGFMNGGMGPQMAMHSPMPGYVQPHFAGHAAAPPAGYMASPRGHPMSHQGSQQGHGQQMYAMPPPGAPMMMQQQQQHQQQQQQHPGTMGPMRFPPGGQFAGGPQGYPMQSRTMSNQNYHHAQMTPRQHHAAPQQGPSPGQMTAVPSGGVGDEGK